MFALEEAPGRQTFQQDCFHATRQPISVKSTNKRLSQFCAKFILHHRINLTLHRLDEVISGAELNEIIEALIAEDNAAALADFG